MKNQKVWLVLASMLIAFSIVFCFSLPVTAQSPHDVTIYFFWGEGCPHCAKAKPFLEELAAAHPDLHLQEYEIYNNSENLALLKEMASSHGFTATKVPTIFIEEKYWEGFTDTIQEDIRKTVVEYLARDSVIGGDVTPAAGGKLIPNKLKIMPLVLIVVGVLLVIMLIALFQRRKPQRKAKK